MADLDIPAPRHTHFKDIKFIKSASTLLQCPRDVGTEVAFIGRSNAGKSSALNAIVGKSIARTSKTPGRTQLMNFFEIDPLRRLVDLPGVGYANISYQVKKQIELFLSDYFQYRQSLQGLIFLMDVRRPLLPPDCTLIDCMPATLPMRVLLTKCDKLSRSAAHRTLISTRTQLEPYTQISVQTFSALRHIGIKEVYEQLNEWFAV